MSERKCCENCKHQERLMAEGPCAKCCENTNHDMWESKSKTPILDMIEERGSFLATPPDKAKELADEHWAYVKSVLDTHVTNAGIIGEIGFHYKTAFVHGYKHGKEDS